MFSRERLRTKLQNMAKSGVIIQGIAILQYKRKSFGGYSNRWKKMSWAENKSSQLNLVLFYYFFEPFLNMSDNVYKGVKSNSWYGIGSFELLSSAFLGEFSCPLSDNLITGYSFSFFCNNVKKWWETREVTYPNGRAVQYAYQETATLV